MNGSDIFALTAIGAGVAKASPMFPPRMTIGSGRGLEAAGIAATFSSATAGSPSATIDACGSCSRSR